MVMKKIAKLIKKKAKPIVKVQAKKVVATKKLPTVKKKSVPKKKVLIAKKKSVQKKKVSVIKKKAVLKKTTPKNKVSVVAKKIASAASGPMGISPYALAKGESYMSAKQLRHFEEILNLWKKQLMQEVDRTIYDLQEVSNYPDPVDRASQEEEFNLKLRERDRERKLLKKIDEALGRIKSGDYGYCDECGSEIGIRRLEARPTATQCIECKTVAEIREKQIGG